MNDFFIGYLLTVAFSTSEVALVLAVSLAFFCFFFFMGYMAWSVDAHGERSEKFHQSVAKARKYVAVAFSICIAAIVFLPGKEDAAYIVAIGLGLKALNNEQMQELPENVARFLNKQIEDALTEAE